jgi:predicted metalloprotease with PDZ domain
VAIRGRYSFGDDDILHMITRIVEHQLEFFGQSPRDHYLFVIEPHPRDDDPEMLHYFGLHFDASMIVLLDPRTDRERLLAEPASLCAHEFFHNWMGEQLSQESYAMNWFVEGVTTLYADRTRLAIRMLDHGSWARDLQEDYRLDWSEASARKLFSLAEAGRTVLSDPAVTRMLYTGGRFAALALDERIVAATHADANLDDLVLALVHRARTEEGFTLTREHLEEEYSRLTGDALGPWLDQYVYGRGDLPLPGYVLGR